MVHPDGDTLLKYVLQTLDDSDQTFVRHHLSLCEECRAEQERMEGDMRRIAGLEIPGRVAVAPPLRHRGRSMVRILRVAAVLATGFLLGYTYAQFSTGVPTVIVQQRLIPSTAKVSSVGHVPAVDVNVTGSRRM